MVEIVGDAVLYNFPLRVWRRQHLANRCLLAVSKAMLHNRLLNRHWAMPLIATSKRVLSQKQKMKKCHREPEGIVIGCAHHPIKGASV